MSDSLVETVRTRLSALLSIGRMSQFASAGFVGTGVDVSVLFLLVDGAGMSPELAKVFAWELAVVVIFLINERWTFARWGATDPRSVGGRFLRSNLIRVGGFLVTVAVLSLLTRRLGVWYMLANLVGIGVGAFVNYSFESIYAWQVHLDR